MRVNSVQVSQVSNIPTFQYENQTVELHKPSSEDLGKLTGVRSLMITGRLISEAFTALCKLTHLKELDLSQADIPHCEFYKINKLENLENLKLSLSHLKELPTCPIPPLRELYERNVCIEVLDSKESLKCSGTILEHIPYVKKIHLKSLIFEGYLVPYCFEWLCTLTELERLDLSQARIPYSKFHNIQKLENLINLKLSERQLEEMPLDLQPLLSKLYERGVLERVSC